MTEPAIIDRDPTIRPLSWRQVRTLTAASIKSRYRNTVAGMVWVILSPLLMFTAQGYVFKLILHVGHPNYPLFLLTGLLPWIFLVSSTSMSTTLFVTNSRLFKSFPIHPFASLVSVLLDNLINFLLAFAIILLGLVIFGTRPALHFLLIPLPLLFLIVAVFAIDWSLACLQVFFHDVRFIVDFAFSILFFLTPIFYPLDLIDPHYRWIVKLNPVAILLEPIQTLSQDTLPSHYWVQLIMAFGVAIALSLLAWTVWSRKKNEIYFRL